MKKLDAQLEVPPLSTSAREAGNESARYWRSKVILNDTSYQPCDLPARYMDTIVAQNYGSNQALFGCI